MAKECQTINHTADIGLAASADSLGELFEALAEGLADVICDRSQVTPKLTQAVEVRSEDVEALAIDFLSRVLGVIQADHFLPAAVQVTEIDEHAVRGELRGEPYAPGRHELKTEVKAVTYHQLRVAREGDKWVGRVILDL